MTGLIYDYFITYEHHGCYIKTFSITSCLDDGGVYSNLEEGNISVRCDAIFLLDWEPIYPVEHIWMLSVPMCFWTDYRLLGF